MSTHRLEDELAIRNILGAMAQLADSESDLQQYRKLFAENGSWTLLAAAGAADQDALTYVGRTQIVDGALSRRKSGGQGPGSNVMHDVSTTVVDFDDDDTARVTSYFKLFGDTHQNPRVLGMGRYFDTFIRTGTGWELSERIVAPA